MSFAPLTGCWFLTGPTASGKTTVAMELAERIDAEIVSLDSMAVYRGMNVGTAKPSAAQRQQIPHHLLDVVDPNETFSLAEYLQLAHTAADEIAARGRQALFVGGTSLYLKALLRGLFEGPPADWEFRRQVETEVASLGQHALHDRLRQVDPLSASRLHPNDTKRIVRALEVCRLTGEPISHLQDQFDLGRSADECRVFVLQWPRAELHRRIEQRVDRMFEEGMIDEVQGLRERFTELSHTARQAVGYGEVLDHLDNPGAIDEVKEKVKTRTRRFARRQLTWFRSLSECQDIEVQHPMVAKDVANQIAHIGWDRITE